MVFSRGEVEEEPRRVQRHVDEEARLRREQLIQQTESDENRTEQFSNQLSSTFLEGESNNKSRERSPFFPLESDENTIEAYKSPRSPKSFFDANAFTDETTSDTTADVSNNH